MTTGKAKYTVAEAASMLAKETGERESELFSRLDAAVLSGDLPAYPRGSQLKINYEAQSTYRRCMQPRGYQEYVYWHDLNKWQDENLQQVSYRFPNPSAPVVTASDGPAKHSKIKPSWATVAMPYMKSLITAGHYKSASMFYKALM